jgi:hypothetical protein
MMPYVGRQGGGVWISVNGSTMWELKNRAFSGALQLTAEKPLFFSLFCPNSRIFC